MSHTVTTSKRSVFILKASGERELFSEAKLIRSLERVKASPVIIEEIVADVQKILKDNMPVTEIYRHAFTILYEKQRPKALKYSLKKAIFELGPEGYAFEKLVAGILKSQGYSVETGKIVRGYCVTHEVDVSATKDDRLIMVEAKFHNRQSLKSDVKVALYVQARFEDIRKKGQAEPQNTEQYHQAWLVTNTRLTSDAIQYANCVGMKTFGWSHPKGGDLQHLINEAGLYPVTCLASLGTSEKKQLVENGIVTSSELAKEKDMLRSLGLSRSRLERVLDEIKMLHDRLNNRL
jgi:hypothetical protein